MTVTYNTILVIVIVVLIILALVVLATKPINPSSSHHHDRFNTGSSHHLPGNRNPNHTDQDAQRDQTVTNRKPNSSLDPDMSGFYDNAPHVTFCNSTLGSNDESKYYIDLLTDFTKFANTITNNSKYMHGKTDGVDDQDDYNYEPNNINTNPNATIWDTTKN